MTESNTLVGSKIVINGVNYIVKKGATLPPKQVRTRKFTQIIGPTTKREESLVRKDVIYKSTGPDDEWILGEYRAMTLVNHFNTAQNSNRTVATFTTNLGHTLEKSSDSLTALIGQKGYDTIFLALCSVISPQLKVKAIVALLTEASTKLSKSDSIKNSTRVNNSCQTDIIPPVGSLKSNVNRKIKQRLGPYVVKDRTAKQIITDPFYVRADTTRKPIRKVIYPPKFNIEKDAVTSNSDSSKTTATPSNVVEKIDFTEERQSSKFANVEPSETLKVLPEINHFFEEDSMSSSISLSHLSVDTGILENSTEYLLRTTEEHTSNGYLSVDESSRDVGTIDTNSTVGLDVVTCDGATVRLPFKPEDIFHLAVPEVLAQLSPEDKIHILCHQAYIDWKYCLHYNEDNNLPIHEAVLANDVPFINRQCIVLKARQTSIDIGDKEHNLSPLQLAIATGSSGLCVSTLLRHGANPLDQDSEGRSALHRAAESARPDLFALIVDHCGRHARNILEDIGEWRSEWEQDSSEQLTHKLFLHIGGMFDSQGYSPAMLASKLGHHQHLQQLLAISSETVNEGMPNAGNTPLYLAVEAACLAIGGCSNGTVVPERYAKTIEVLLDYGADPNIDNFNGSNVNTLLTEFNWPGLCMLFSNKQMSLQNYNGVNASEDLRNRNNIILMKQEISDTTLMNNDDGVNDKQGSLRADDGNGSNERKRQKLDTDVVQCQTVSKQRQIYNPTMELIERDQSLSAAYNQCFFKGKLSDIQQYFNGCKLIKVDGNQRNNDSKKQLNDIERHNVVAERPTINTKKIEHSPLKVLKVATRTIKSGQMLIRDSKVTKICRPTANSGKRLVMESIVMPSVTITKVASRKRKPSLTYIVENAKKTK